MHGSGVAQPGLSICVSTELWQSIANRTEKATQQSRCLVSKICHLSHSLHYCMWICINIQSTLPANYLNSPESHLFAQIPLLPWLSNPREPACTQRCSWCQRELRKSQTKILSLKNLCSSDKCSLIVKFSHWFIHLTNIYWASTVYLAHHYLALKLKQDSRQKSLNLWGERRWKRRRIKNMFRNVKVLGGNGLRKDI